VTPEREPAYRGLRRRRGAAPVSQEHRDSARRNGEDQQAAAESPGVTIGGDHMGREQRREQAAQGDVRRLKVAMAAPEAPARRCHGGRRHAEQQDERSDSRQLIQRRGDLQILEDCVVGDERHQDMERRRAEGDPAEHLVATEGSRTGGCDCRGRTGQAHNTRQINVAARPRISASSQPMFVKPATSGSAATTINPAPQAK